MNVVNFITFLIPILGVYIFFVGVKGIKTDGVAVRGKVLYKDKNPVLYWVYTVMFLILGPLFVLVGSMHCLDIIFN